VIEFLGGSDRLLALAWALPIAAMLAAILLRAAARPRAAPILWALALLPTIVTYLAGPVSRAYHYHGFLQQSIVYQILEDGLPPVNPLLAGETVRYAWGAHLVVAGVTRALGVSPAWSFALLNVGGLAISVLLLHRAARRLADREGAVLGVTLSFFAFTCMPILYRIAPAWLVDGRGGQPVEKFSDLQPMAMGLTCCAIVIHAVVRLVDGRDRPAPALLALFAGVAACGFFYPLLWLGIVAGGGAAVLAIWLRFPALRRRVVLAGAAAGAGAAAVLPYLLLVANAHAEAPPLSLAGPRHIAAYGANVLFALLPLAALALWARRDVADAARAHAPAFWALGTFAAANALVSAAVTGPVDPGIEYKYRMLAFIAIGLLAGTAVSALRRRSAIAAFALLAIFLMPMVNNLRGKIAYGAPTDPFREDGVLMRHADPDQDELYRWIAANTPPHAALVDTHLTIPVFARRALFVGTDLRRERARRERGDAERFRDGWTLDAERTLPQVVGGAAGEIARRVAAARAVLDGGSLDRACQAFTETERRGAIDGIFVVARDGPTRERLEGDARFERVFANGAASIYRFGGDVARPGRGPDEAR
jgi:hypothetical protein